ncbi:MAG: acyl-CoA reductase [Verrucomicrobiota bacterium]
MNTADIQATLSQTAGNWLVSGSRWRTRAIAEAPELTGFSPEMVNEAITLIFGALKLEALKEFKVPVDAPRRITHILSGNVPAPGIGSICQGLLLNAINLVKCSQRDPVFPTLFVESLREVNAELAARVTVRHWSREETSQTRTALAGADAVFAYGDDDSIASLRGLTPVTAKFFGYGYKISFAIVGQDASFTGDLMAAAAFDASVYDQQGCMSPHAFFIEGDARAFAELLAQAMEDYQCRVPRGKQSIEEAALAAQVREAYEFRSANDSSVAIWSGNPPYPWMVIYDEAADFTPSCLNRTVFVKPSKTLNAIRAWTGKISTVGVAPWNDRLRCLAGDLAERVCPIGQMQRPTLLPVMSKSATSANNEY